MTENDSSTDTGSPDAQDQEALRVIRQVQMAFDQLHEQVGKVIVGQRTVIDQVLVSLFCRGHALLVGVPGLAKT
ncbi:MAG: AAA family ATPase, partial [Anaerolineae bacterium]